MDDPPDFGVAPLRRSLDLDGPLDLIGTLRLHWRGSGDPTMRLGRGTAARASRTADGPATLEIRLVGADRVEARAWGAGASAALTGLEALLGLDEDAAGFEPNRHPLVTRLARELRGVRLGRTGAVFEALFPAILEQKVTGTEASSAFRGLVLRYGEPAPGPFRLRLQPAPAVLAGLPYYAFHPFGVEQRRADVIRRVARDAARLARLAGGPPAAAAARLQRYPGIGPWTAAEVAVRAFGDPDAVSIGDFHLPNLVAWALAGEPRGDDARMLELLEPWRGHRARVVRLLELSGMVAPRYGPRLPARDIRRG